MFRNRSLSILLGAAVLAMAAEPAAGWAPRGRPPRPYLLGKGGEPVFLVGGTAPGGFLGPPRAGAARAPPPPPPPPRRRPPPR